MDSSALAYSAPDFGVLYKHLKTKYQIVTPVRGRSPEIRPIGNRRRLHETVHQIDLGADKPLDERYAYAARLYDTDCVVAYPDNTVELRTGGYCTISTAAFIEKATNHLLYAAKTRKTIWVWARMAHSEKLKATTKYPLGKEPVRFKLALRETFGEGSSGKHVITEPVGEMTTPVQRVDRKVTRAYHEQVRPFLDWVQAFLAMSDGWLMHETVKTVMPVFRDKDGDATGRYRLPTSEHPNWEKALSFAKAVDGGYGPNSVVMHEAFEWVTTLHEDDYLLALSILAQRWANRRSFVDEQRYRLAETFERSIGSTRWPVRFYDMRLEFGAVKRFLYGIIASHPEAKKIVMKTPDNKFRALA